VRTTRIPPKGGPALLRFARRFEEKREPGGDLLGRQLFAPPLAAGTDLSEPSPRYLDGVVKIMKIRVESGKKTKHYLEIWRPLAALIEGKLRRSHTCTPGKLVLLHSPLLPEPTKGQPQVRKKSVRKRCSSHGGDSTRFLVSFQRKFC
jgi:hypothetical protein